MIPGAWISAYFVELFCWATVPVDSPENRYEMLVCIDILALLFAFELLRQFDGSRAPTTIVSASARVTHGSLRLWLPGLTLFKLVLHLWQFPQPAGSNKKTAVAAHTREIMAPPFDAAARVCAAFLREARESRREGRDPDYAALVPSSVPAGEPDWRAAGVSWDDSGAIHLADYGT